MSEVPLEYTTTESWPAGLTLIEADRLTFIRCRLGGGNLKGFKDHRTENGSSQGQNLALTALCVPNSRDSGHTQSSGGCRTAS